MLALTSSRHLRFRNLYFFTTKGFLHHDRVLGEPPTFIATPIFYVNADPHIGHLYTSVYADAIHRFSKLIKLDSTHIFSTGTDEHGLKIQRSAELNNQDLLSYCSEISNKFRLLFDAANISYTNYIRTTDLQHKIAVSHLWKSLLENGYIYKSYYKGYYSINDESFVPENMIATNSNGQKISIESGHILEWHEEENYMFRLSSLQNQLIDWMDNKLIMKPNNFHAVLKADARNIKNLKDISISRSRSRLKWGIEVPNDPTQMVYVWFDALINYLTVAGYPDKLKCWPSSHIIGKDIIKFHCIYWPAFLLAAKLEPPNLIYCHSHWLYDNQKMSKSKGNVVDPFECIEKFSPDGIRYFLLKEGTPHSDSNFTMEKIKICLNADLANTLGNLLNRCTSKKLNKNQNFPKMSQELLLKYLPEAAEIIESSKTLASNCYQAYTNGDFYIGISQVMLFLNDVNGLLTDVQPWTLTNSASQQHRLDSILCFSLEAIRISAILLSPIIPHSSQSIFKKLNIGGHMQTWRSVENAFAFSEHETSINKLDRENYMVFAKLA